MAEAGSPAATAPSPGSRKRALDAGENGASSLDGAGDTDAVKRQKTEQGHESGADTAGEPSNMTGNEGEGDTEGDGDDDAASEKPKDDSLSQHQRLVTARRYLASQTHPVIIPSFATWFSLATIDPIERKALPEFFNAKNRSKTPSIYKDYRDFMVNTYRLNPSEYLTVTACRRNLAGDVCAIMRVHAFLEQWGLINYQVRCSSAFSSSTLRAHICTQIDTSTRPAALAPPWTGHFRLLVDSPRGLAPLHPGTKPPKAIEPQELRKDVFKADPLKVNKPDERLDPSKASESAEGLAATANGDAAPMAAPKACDVCSTSTHLVRYQSIKARPTYTICPSCYSEGRFPASMHSGEFVRIDNATSTSQHRHGTELSWSDQETLLLLEGLEMHGDNWDAISDHVGSRSKEQCIAHFLQLPIEDPYLEPTRSDIGPLQYNRVPFNDVDNPVMSVLAFLASSVDREVAAKAAGDAVEQMEATLKKQALEARERLQKEREGVKVPGAEPTDPEEEPMAVDGGDAEPKKENDDESKQVEASSSTSRAPRAPRDNVERAAAIALGSAAAKAHVLALEEDATLHSLVTSVVEAQVRKLELKMAHYDQLESLVEVERRSLELSKQQVYDERLKMQRMMAEVQALHQRAKQNPGAISQQDISTMLGATPGAAARPMPVQAPGQAPALPPGAQYTQMSS